MVGLNTTHSLHELQNLIKAVYGLPNKRNFELGEMLTHIQRFSMRGMKSLRKNYTQEAIQNICIAFSWFLSTIERLDIALEQEVWKRFPYCCSYCGNLPCSCAKEKGRFTLRCAV